MKKVSMKDMDTPYFWVNYFGCSYPNAYDEEEDVSVSDLMQEILTEESGRWWEQFTGYYDGSLEENDGYLDEPASLEVMLTRDKCMKIEFHPGDTLYYINGEKIGSTGPHWEVQTIPYEEVRQLLEIDFDPEGSMFCAYSREKDALADFILRFKEACEDRALISDLFSRAELD